MTTQTKILIALAAALAVSMVVSTIWSNRKIVEFERRATDAVITADKLEHDAIESEKRATEYLQKVELLEAQASELRTQTRRQDEKLEKATTNVRAARRNVERVRGTKQADTDERQLCEQLGAVGHECQ